MLNLKKTDAGPAFTPRTTADSPDSASLAPPEIVDNMYLPPLVGTVTGVAGFFIAHRQIGSALPALALGSVAGLSGFASTALVVDNGHTLQSKAVQIMLPLGMGAAVATPLILALGPNSHIPHYIASMTTFGGWFLRFPILYLLGADGLLR